MRYADWQKRFWAELERQRVLKFKYGKHDCVLFAAAMADAITMDGDFTKRAQEAFKWINKREALKLLGSRTLRDMIEDVLGPMAKWTTLGQGDLLLTLQEGQQLVAVHDGVQPIASGDRALVRLSWDVVVGGWRI
jgi:hypothetical protein